MRADGSGAARQGEGSALRTAHCVTLVTRGEMLVAE
jgi:hypothetical protein